ncbi:MAG: ATP-grasp domain-containing protein [Anaerolineales bacterium]|nr:ATP-grasp domain-containing protein [Anaerolineales bacterium]MCB9146211.1 ATP-grasp domain-containing protein [Anaerolineales bacterium]
MTNILLTGGRAPVTLDLARAFHRAGHTVFMAESLRGHLSQASAAVKANFVVPAPHQETEAFLAALRSIIEQNQIDLLIPTCEEVFHIAKGLDSLPCKVFTEPLAKLDIYHNKWKFVINAVNHNLRVPESMLVKREDDLLHAFASWRRLVLKPVYSRFAARTLILPSLKQALSTLIFDEPWIAQEYIVGQQFCSYSVCHDGRITAHAVYPTIFTAGQGATIAFQPVEHAGIFEWVRTFVERFNVTGQMAFDFIETPQGDLYALECNPRATSGAHLLTNNPQFVESFFKEGPFCVTPFADSSHMLGTAMLVYGLPAALRDGNFRAWLRAFLHSDDVILDFRDLKPFLLQWRSIFEYVQFGRRMGISVLEASTFDIEWNGEWNQ